MQKSDAPQIQLRLTSRCFTVILCTIDLPGSQAFREGDVYAVAEGGVELSRAQLEQMIAQARADAPLETCGLLDGHEGRVTRVLPAPNILRSRVSYQMGGQEFADAMIACDFEPLAIYHSHPQGPPVPSPTDIAESFYPDSIYVIISLAQEPPSVRAFRIVDGVVTEEICQVSET